MHGRKIAAKLVRVSVRGLVESAELVPIQYIYYHKTSIKRRVPNNRRVSNKRPGLLEIQSCQMTSRTLYVMVLTQIIPIVFLPNQIDIHAEN